MKPTPGTVSVMVATENVDDAKQILRQLKDDFKNVHSSTNPDLAVQDFEKYKPQVLMLAFDRLEKAERYYLGLYRQCETLHQYPHRTVILCSKDEVRAAFDLCKKEYFDDYILYWPQTFDGPRVAMSTWIACRQMTEMHADTPRPAELRAHARHLGELEKTLDREFADGEQQVAAARGSLLQAEREVGGAIDEFSRRLLAGGSAGLVDAKHADALAREIEQFKNQQIAQTRRIGASGVESMSAWADKLKGQVQPAMAGTRALTDKVRAIRPIVMVVDDDELVLDLAAKALGQAYETILLGDGAAALSQLRRVRPDAILMDLRMPGMDGVMLTKRLKATPHFADIPVVMMTGDARRESLVSSMEAGVVEFVVKPFTRESLAAKLEKVLR